MSIFKVLAPFLSLAACATLASAAAGDDTASHFPLASVSVESLGTPRSDHTEIAYRWWATRGHSDFGIGLGALTSVARAGGGVSGFPVETSLAAPATVPVLTLGVRYRSSERATLVADASRTLGTPSDEEQVQGNSTLPGLRVQPSRLSLVHGGVGLQLADDTRMMLRMRKGGLGLLMRRTF